MAAAVENGVAAPAILEEPLFNLCSSDEMQTCLLNEKTDLENDNILKCYGEYHDIVILRRKAKS